MFYFKSVALTVLAFILMGAIIPVSVIITKGIFRVTYLSWIHGFIYWIIIAVSTTNLIIFLETWRNSTAKTEEEHIERMKQSMKRSNFLMASTSIASSLPLFSITVSTFMPIKSLAIYSGVTALISYILSAIILPAGFKICDILPNNPLFCIRRKRTMTKVLPATP